MNWRMSGPHDVAHQTRTAFGRTYTATPGTVITCSESDGRVLAANGWNFISQSGPTSARPAGSITPNPAHRGDVFFDETLNKMIEFDGVSWIDPASGATV